MLGGSETRPPGGGADEGDVEEDAGRKVSGRPSD